MENPPTLEAEPVPRKPGRFWIAAAVVAAVMVVGAVSVYTWYALYGPCRRASVNSASDALFQQVYAFEAAYQAAASTTPIGLVGPVTRMQEILRDTREVPVPACMQIARNELVTSMESAIRAFLAIMTRESDQTIADLMADSIAHVENFSTEMDAVNKCAPFCP